MELAIVATVNWLIQRIKTRLNSIHNLPQKFILLSEEIASVLVRISESPNMLTAADPQLTNEIVEVLCSLEKATREACGQKFVTAS